MKPLFSKTLRASVGGKVNFSAPSFAASWLTRPLKRSRTSSNTALRPNTPGSPVGMISPLETRPS